MRGTIARAVRDEGGSWYCRPYLGTDKVTHRPIRPFHRCGGPAATEAQAQAEADRWIAEWLGRHPSVAEGGIAPRVSEMVEDHIASLERGGCAPSTAKTYRMALRNWIAPAIGGAAPDDVTPRDVAAVMDSMLESGLSPSTARVAFAALSGAYARWESQGLCTSDPCTRAARPVERRARARWLDSWELEQVRAALAEAETADGAARSYARVCALMLETGMRCGEACALRVRDVSWVDLSLLIDATVSESPEMHRQGYGKTRTARRFPMGERLSAYVSGLVAERRKALGSSFTADVPLVPNSRGGWIRPSSVSHWFTGVLADYAIEDATLHTLRHTFATLLLADGCDLKTVQELMGHSWGSTTLDMYAHAVPARGREAAGRYEDIVRGALERARKGERHGDEEDRAGRRGAER